MNKKYIVRLTDEERAICEATIKKETGKAERQRRATILLRRRKRGRRNFPAAVKLRAQPRLMIVITEQAGPMAGFRHGTRLEIRRSSVTRRLHKLRPSPFPRLSQLRCEYPLDPPDEPFGCRIHDHGFPELGGLLLWGVGRIEQVLHGWLLWF